jgi:hypothetical protein
MTGAGQSAYQFASLFVLWAGISALLVLAWLCVALVWLALLSEMVR